MKGGEKLYVDSNQAGLLGAIKLSWRGATAALCKVSFSLCKAALSLRKRLIVVGGILANLSAFVPMTTVACLVKA